MTSSDDPATSRSPDPLEVANARLDEACARVAARLDELAGRARTGVGADAPAGDAPALQAALTAAKAREAALAAAAQDASDALEAAMVELGGLGAHEGDA